jgi:membrane-bound metal-dependent hydrolase YbcI (DUF457 family)
VDIVTHALASLAVARGFSPRAGKAAVAGAMVAGTIADVDWLSKYFDPSAFLTWQGTYTHSILAAILISAGVAASAAVILMKSRSVRGTGPEGAAAINPGQSNGSRAFNLAPVLYVSLCAALLHIAMDACQSDGVMLFWPFSFRRVALDWLPGIDPWILTILIGAIAIPELLRLVGSEIGAKSKKPRGQTGALIGLALIFVYVGARATLHSNVIALLGSRTFHGEASRRAWAFPEPLSLLTWHGVVETESALDRIHVNAASARDFDPDLSLRTFKPESSPALAAARNTVVAKRFLAAAQIPKASVEKIQAGYIVILRDLRYAASGDSKHEVAAYIELDRNNQVTSQELVWARDLKNY